MNQQINTNDETKTPNKSIARSPSRKSKSNSNNNNTKNANNDNNKKTKSPSKNNKQQKRNKNKKSNKKKAPKKNPTKQLMKEAIEQELTLEQQGRYVALDCEFVGVGPGGHKSALARVSIVDYDNNVLIDTYTRVNEPVTNYRTFVSGITKENLLSDVAMDADKCIEIVKKLLHNKILVGHGLKNDMDVLGFDHPWYDTRDTAKYEPFMKKAKKDTKSTLPRPRKLKDLAMTKLDREIQKDGEPHCSIEDAIAALDLYKKARTKWELAMSYKIDRTRQIEFLDSIETEQTEN